MELGKSKTLCEGFLSSKAGEIHRSSIRKIKMARANVELSLQKNNKKKETKKALKRSVQVVSNELKTDSSKKTWLLLKNMGVKPFQKAALNSILGSDVLAISYFLDEERLSTIGIYNGEIICAENRAINLDNLKSKYTGLVKAIQNNHKAEVKKLGADLYFILLEGYTDYINKCDKIIISCHSLLHFLPFAALYDGSNYVGQKAPVSYIFSFTFLKLLQDRFDTGTMENQMHRALIIGNPENSIKKHCSLPSAEEEAESISHIMQRHGQNTLLLTGRKATEKKMKSVCDEYNLLHFATHSYFNPENAEKSFILLSNQQYDGLLHASEIYNLSFNRPIESVILSSCESGLNDIKMGDDLFGLSRSWYYAGAKKILSSICPVHDKHTKMMMKSLYRYMFEKNCTLSNALFLAKKELISSGNVDCFAFRLQGLTTN